MQLTLESYTYLFVVTKNYYVTGFAVFLVFPRLYLISISSICNTPQFSCCLLSVLELSLSFIESHLSVVLLYLSCFSRTPNTNGS
jgi:hypothetical protein